MASALQKRIIQSWIVKGNSENDIFNCFISFWIAFNVIYLSRYPVDGDGACIKEVKKDSHFVSEYKMLLKNKTFFASINTLLKESPITSEKTGISYTFKVNDFSALIDVLYQVRNNLLHGGKNVNEKRDKEVVSAALPVLKALITKFMKYT
jgi:hypothetical protein